MSALSSLRGRGVGNGIGDGLVLVLSAGATLLAVLLVAIASLGGMFALVAILMAGSLMVLAALGNERTGFLALMGAFFTAPWYKGFAPSPGSIVTGTDLLFVVGFGLLFPQLIGKRVHLPIAYLIGVLTVLTAGLVSSVFSEQALASFMALVFWMTVMIGLPLAIALWGPPGRWVDLLACSFVAGQMFSLAAGIAKGNRALGRDAGLSTHPNYLAQAGLLSIALLLYLWHRHHGKSWFINAALLGAAAVCSASVILSGSRAGTLVVAVLILMVPIVERSAVKGFALALLGALLIVAFPLIAGSAGEGSSIARLGGDKSAEFSNSARTLGLEGGLARFFAHPLRGDGIVDLYEIHNNFLEVAVSIGIFGLAGYLLVLFAFARPLFGSGEFRRLSYAVWGYIGFGATVPSLYDRSIWAVVALSVVAMTEFERRKHVDTHEGPHAFGDDGPTPTEELVLVNNSGDPQ
ncbi:MAG: hypothetical protein JWO11_2950 [Nocardioides sp.]|nr:hypothetical protein [Nocardioides sp.]